MFCSNCGKKLDEGSKFCANCGSAVDLNVKEEEPLAINPAETAGQHETFSETRADIPLRSGKKANPLIYIIPAILLIGLLVFIIAIVKSNIAILSPDYLKQGNEADISMDDGKRHSQSYAGSSEIRNFDLLNRRVKLNDYILEYFEGGDYNQRYITLVKGVFETGEKDSPEGVIYEVLKESIVYTDLDGDGSEEVIFQVFFNNKGANGSPTIIEIYRIKDGKPTLAAHINQETLNKDLNRYYPDSFIWERLNFKVDGGKILIFVDVDGFHARAYYIGTMTYTLAQNGLKLMGKPKLRKNE